jgi:hypothetical protein
VTKTLGVGGSVRFQVPPEPQFEEYHALRIVPGKGLYHNLSATSWPDPSLYNIYVDVGSPTISRPINLTKSLLYLGLGDNLSLRTAVRNQPASEWKPKFCQYVQLSLPGTGECEAHPLLLDPVYIAFNLGKEETVPIRLDHLSGDGKLIWSSVKRVSFRQSGITTIYWEVE